MNTDDKETSFLTCLYNKFLIKQGLLKSKLISVAGMSSELRVIGNYAVSILTFRQKLQVRRLLGVYI